MDDQNNPYQDRSNLEELQGYEEAFAGLVESSVTQRTDEGKTSVFKEHLAKVRARIRHLKTLPLTGNPE